MLLDSLKANVRREGEENNRSPTPSLTASFFSR